MSTRVTPDEWGSLRVAQRPSLGCGKMGVCDIEPLHGAAHVLLATLDNRALSPCDGCYEEIRKVNNNLPADAILREW